MLGSNIVTTINNWLWFRDGKWKVGNSKSSKIDEGVKESSHCSLNVSRTNILIESVNRIKGLAQLLWPQVLIDYDSDTESEKLTFGQVQKK